MNDQEQQLASFAQEFERMEHAMLNMDGAADMDGSFYPELRKLVSRYDEQIIVDYAINCQYPLGSIEYLIKAGIKSFDKDYLLQFTSSDEELEAYDGAYFLALCGYDEGYELLYTFAMGTHPLYSGYISPIVDMIEDLAYADDERATNLIATIKETYAEYFK
ncbi:MAG: hypothetical protein R8G66_26905 [Cytophagales bacterium]|nr:hypothetical protein [Cytophagales bacterium]